MAEEFDKRLEPLFNVLNDWLDLDQDTFQAMQPELRVALNRIEFNESYQLIEDGDSW